MVGSAGAFWCFLDVTVVVLLLMEDAGVQTVCCLL